MRGGKRKNTRPKGRIETGPILMRNAGFETVKAICVYVAKTCKCKTISPQIMLFTVEALLDLMEGGYRDRRRGKWMPQYTE